MISLRIEGYRKDSEQLYNAIHEISCALYQQFHCDCFIQVDYLIDDDGLTAYLRDKVEFVLQRYSGKVSIDHFRLIESGCYHSSHSSAFSSRYFFSSSKELVRLYCIVLLDVSNSSAISVSFIPSK